MLFHSRRRRGYLGWISWIPVWMGIALLGLQCWRVYRALQ